jgi:hypothetical protein
MRDIDYLYVGGMVSITIPIDGCNSNKAGEPLPAPRDSIIILTEKSIKNVSCSYYSNYQTPKLQIPTPQYAENTLVYKNFYASKLFLILPT